MPIVAFQNVTKNYFTDDQPVRALDNLSLEVSRGEFVAIVGRSGCGKSTLLSLAGAMDFPTAGEVLVDGIATSSLKDDALTRLRREKVGFIFQSFQLIHTLTVFENVELPLLLAGKKNARETARERLAWVELDGLGERCPHQLSGGQMQRVAIARALVQSPSTLSIAEVTSGESGVTLGSKRARICPSGPIPASSPALLLSLPGHWGKLSVWKRCSPRVAFPLLCGEPPCSLGLFRQRLP